MIRTNPDCDYREMLDNSAFIDVEQCLSHPFPADSLVVLRVIQCPFKQNAKQSGYLCA
jgi:hypothetical protein